MTLTKEQVLQNYNDVFTGLGTLPGVYHIDTDPNVKPVQNNLRRVAIPIKEELKNKLTNSKQWEFLPKLHNQPPG